MRTRLLSLATLVTLIACGSGDQGSASQGSIPNDPGDGAVTLDAGALPDAMSSGDGGDGGDAASTMPEVDIDKIPWATGASVGFGVASKDTGNPRGESSFIAYAGFNVDLASAEAWATALYRATLRDRGVRYVWAVQGPNDAQYTNQEIGNSKIAAALLPVVSASSKFVLVVGHSSGSFVAHELLGQLNDGADPLGITAHRVVYFDLDGGESGLNAAVVGRLKNAYFAASHDGATYSPNASTMQSLGATYAAAGGYYENDASGSGCNAGAVWCVHVTLVTTKPHDPTNADAAHDYLDFVGRPVCQSYLDAKATEAGLVR